MAPGAEKAELDALILDSAALLDDVLGPEVRVAEVETSVTDNEPGILTVTGGRPDPGGALDVPLPDQEAETLLLFTGVSEALAALVVGLPVPDVGDDSGVAAELDEFKPTDVDGPPVIKVEGFVSVDDGPERIPVAELEALSDGRDDGPLAPEDAGGLPAG